MRIGAFGLALALGLSVSPAAAQLPTESELRAYLRSKERRAQEAPTLSEREILRRLQERGIIPVDQRDPSEPSPQERVTEAELRAYLRSSDGLPTEDRRRFG